jgi:8-oxo-dGTP diphosphatase
MKQFFVGAKAIIQNDKHEILLLMHATKGFWDLPGGRIDGNETIEQAVEREVSEELPGSSGLSIGDLVHAERLHKDVSGNVGLLLLIYEAVLTLPDGLLLSDEHSNYAWVSKEKAMTMTDGLIKTAISKINLS